MSNASGSDDGPIEELAGARVEAFGLLLEGSSLLHANIERDLQTDGNISLSELEVLIHLANEPDRGLRPRELAERSAISTGGATRILDRLEQQGLVDRTPHSTDRRGLVVELTQDGVDFLRSVLPDHFASIEDHLWSVLDADELRQLGEIMRKVRDANRPGFTR